MNPMDWLKALPSSPADTGGFVGVPTSKCIVPWSDEPECSSLPLPTVTVGSDEDGFSPTPSMRKPIGIWCDEEAGFQLESTRKPVSQWADSLGKDEKHRKKKPNLTEPEEGLFSQRISLNLSQVAAHLIKQHKFCRIGKGWGVYLDSHWQLVTEKEAMREVICDLLDSDTAQYVSTAQLDEIASKVRLSPDILRYAEIPKIDPHLLSCKDGFYQWPEGYVLPPDSSILRFNYLDVSADEIGPQPTPYFDRFLENVADGDDAIAQRVLEVISVILTGYPVKNFFLFEGESNTGKSQLATFLKRLLGSTSCFAVNDVNDLGGTWTTGMLPGKLLCLCSDVPDRPLSTKAVGLIKQLTGGDPINGAIKYKSNIVFDNTAKLLFLSNFPLKISGNREDVALNERLVRVPFRYSVPAEQRIPDIHKKLEQESGGIIWQALQALERFEERGLTFSAIEDNSIPSVPNERDLIQKFVQECCALEAGAFSYANDLCAAYNSFKNYRLHMSKSIPVSSFSKMLMSLGYPIERQATNQKRGYRGIRFCAADDRTSFTWR